MGGLVSFPKGGKLRKLTAEVDARLSEGPPVLPEKGEESAQFQEVTIPTGSRSVGKTIAELGIPRSAVLVSIRCGKEIIIPRGDTQVWDGDVVTMLCEREMAAEVKDILRSKSNPK